MAGPKIIPSSGAGAKAPRNGLSTEGWPYIDVGGSPDVAAVKLS